MRTRSRRFRRTLCLHATCNPINKRRSRRECALPTKIRGAVATTYDVHTEFKMNRHTTSSLFRLSHSLCSVCTTMCNAYCDVAKNCDVHQIMQQLFNAMLGKQFSFLMSKIVFCFKMLNPKNQSNLIILIGLLQLKLDGVCLNWAS